MKAKITARSLTVCALVAALYTALCLALAPLSYGMVQIRAAEALTLLPVYSPLAVVGVTLGCALSNLIGFLSGANPLGLVDTLFGTAATLIAAIISWKVRKVRWFGLPVLSALAPVIINAVIIGLELTLLEAGAFSPVLFGLNALYVGCGQAVACLGLGLPMVHLLDRSGIGARSFGQHADRSL